MSPPPAPRTDPKNYNSSINERRVMQASANAIQTNEPIFNPHIEVFTCWCCISTKQELDKKIEQSVSIHALCACGNSETCDSSPFIGVALISFSGNNNLLCIRKTRDSLRLLSSIAYLLTNIIPLHLCEETARDFATLCRNDLDPLIFTIGRITSLW